jgi:excisionase family DNA binding protein
MKEDEIAGDVMKGRILLTPDQLARVLQVPRRLIYTPLVRGDFPIRARKIGRLLRFASEDVKSWLNGA